MWLRSIPRLPTTPKLIVLEIIAASPRAAAPRRTRYAEATIDAYGDL